VGIRDQSFSSGSVGGGKKEGGEHIPSARFSNNNIMCVIILLYYLLLLLRTFTFGDARDLRAPRDAIFETTTDGPRGLTRCQDERRHHHNNIILYYTPLQQYAARAERQYIKSSGKKNENENRNSSTRATMIIKLFLYTFVVV